MVIDEYRMKPVSILILADAGAAGRDLLVRRDVELAWALTVPEALANLGRRRPRIVLVRSQIAAQFMEQAKDMLERVPVVILVSEHDWPNRERFFGLGATALVSSKSQARIMEAISELTGLPSRYAPRVPYPEVVDVSLSGARIYLEATEIGTSGIAVRDFPPARVGDQVEISLVMMDPSLALSGMVVRSHISRSGSVTEIAFNALNDQERGFLESFVHRESGRAAEFPEPIGLTSDLTSTTFTLDLFQAMGGHASSDRWIQILKERQRSDSEVRAPRWLIRVEREITELERSVVKGASSCPAFARASLEMRLDLGRAQAMVVDQSSLRESCELALDFCRTLATDAQGSTEMHLAMVPEIRAGILSQVYGWTAVSEKGVSNSSAA